MTEAITPDELMRRATCPTCDRELPMEPQRDGYNRPLTERPYRFPLHAGKLFGLWCKNSGELQK